MLLLEARAELMNPRYSWVPMDARTAARAADVKVGTLNAWFARGLIPGVTLGPSGKRRDVDFETAVRIAVFAQLTKHHITPDHASQIVSMMTDDATKGGFLFFATPDAYVAAESDRTLSEGDQVEDAAVPRPQPTPNRLPQIIRRAPIRRRPDVYVDEGPGGRFVVGHVRLHADIDTTLQYLVPQPSVYVVVDVGRFAARVRDAEREWKHSRRAKS